MKIHYLKDLENFPEGIELFNNRGISLEEIEALELTYNSGNQFPQALRELLFIAGDYCVCFDYFFNISKMQVAARRELNSASLASIGKFICIDANGAFGNDDFLFVYGNDSKEDPLVWHLSFNDGVIQQINSLGELSKLINEGINKLKEGRSPF